MYLKNHITFHGDKPSTISCLASAGSRTLLKVIAVSAVGTAISQGLTSCIFFGDRFADVLEQYGCVTQNGPKMNIPGCTWAFFFPTSGSYSKNERFCFCFNFKLLIHDISWRKNSFIPSLHHRLRMQLSQSNKLLRKTPQVFQISPCLDGFGCSKNPSSVIYLDNIWIIFG